MNLTIIAAPTEAAAELKADIFVNALTSPPTSREPVKQTDGFRFVRGEGTIKPNYRSFTTPCVGTETAELFVVLVWH